MIDSSRRPGQPLLSLTIPTFNRGPYLAQLLESLLPQFAALNPADAELIISDNCSQDDTPAIVASFMERGLRCRYVRNEVNLGADGNFLQCLHLAQGQYAWLMGDDDLLVPGALQHLLTLLSRKEVDLVYLSSFSFRGEMAAQQVQPRSDRLGRYAEIVKDGVYFLEKVNALLGLISVMLVNKNRLLATEHPPLEKLMNTNLLQMGWLFPLVRKQMEVLYVWERLVAYRLYNSGGWGICEVFGVRLHRIAREYFQGQPELSDALMNGVLRYWLCDAIVGMRRGLHADMNAENFAKDLHHLFAGNWRYWLFVWPVSRLPLPLARWTHRGLYTVNRAARVIQGVSRHVLGRHGTYLKPV